MYGDSQKNLLENLAVVIILCPISSVCGSLGHMQEFFGFPKIYCVHNRFMSMQPWLWNRSGQAEIFGTVKQNFYTREFLYQREHFPFHEKEGFPWLHKREILLDKEILCEISENSLWYNQGNLELATRTFIWYMYIYVYICIYMYIYYPYTNRP